MHIMREDELYSSGIFTSELDEDENLNEDDVDFDGNDDDLDDEDDELAGEEADGEWNSKEEWN